MPLDKRSTIIDLRDWVLKSSPSQPDPFLDPSTDVPSQKEETSTSSSSKREASPPPEQPAKRTQIKGLHSVTRLESGDLSIRNASPWNTYKKTLEGELAGAVEMGVAKSPPYHLRVLRRLHQKHADQTLDRFRKVGHENVDRPFQCFQTGEWFYAVFELVPLTLLHLVACGVLPDEPQVATILVQILNGLLHLESSRFRLESLRCSTVLMKLDGTVKIACFEHCTTISADDTATGHAVAVGRMTVELLQGYPKAGGAIGLDNPAKWSGSLLDFLSQTTSTNSIEKLRHHPYIHNHRSHKGDLVGLAYFALIKARTSVRLLASSHESRVL